MAYKIKQSIKPPRFQFRALCSSCMPTLAVSFLRIIQMKRCSKCKQMKSVSEFYVFKKGKDGFQSYCKACDKKYKQGEKSKSYQKRYFQSERGKLAIKRFNARHPNYVKAKNAVTHAVTTGKLPRSDTLQCYYCDKPAQQYHHWHGYEQEHWLDVVPACRECHTNIHRKIA